MSLGVKPISSTLWRAFQHQCVDAEWTQLLEMGMEPALDDNWPWGEGKEAAELCAMWPFGEVRPRQ